ncbi:MAG: VanZ family protein [Gammaproteobacteria bacterium]|nr:VanZ family protein [Gammaproteobacteria bacterium]
MPMPAPDSTLRFRWLWWSIAALGLALDIYLSLKPAGDGPGLLNDKLAHFLVYFMLTGWFCLLLPRRRLLVFVAAVLLGGALEIAQSFTPQRVMDPLDALANAAGAFIALLIVRRLPVNLLAWLETKLP